jgi:hypothetical protein
MIREAGDVVEQGVDGEVATKRILSMGTEHVFLKTKMILRICPAFR